MNHLHSNNRDINLINYMANSTRVEGDLRSEFLSFCKLKGTDVYWGMNLFAEWWGAVHLYKGHIWSLLSDDEEREKEDIAQSKLCAVMVKGSDNASYVKRFENEEEIVPWLNAGVDSRDMLFYNS